jgi:uncharacterized OB-fold protein
MTRILPRPTALSQPYWDGCREGVLRLQRCAECTRFQFYPRCICSHCHSNRLEWQAVSGRGVLASYTVVQRGISAAYPAPYVVALIDLAEGPRMMSSVIGAEPGQLRVGAAVEVSFVEWSPDIDMPVFRLIEYAEGESI